MCEHGHRLRQSGNGFPACPIGSVATERGLFFCENVSSDSVTPASFVAICDAVAIFPDSVTPATGWLVAFTGSGNDFLRQPGSPVGLGLRKMATDVAIGASVSLRRGVVGGSEPSVFLVAFTQGGNDFLRPAGLPLLPWLHEPGPFRWSGCWHNNWACLIMVTSVGKPVNGLAGCWLVGRRVGWLVTKKERRAL